MCVFYKGGNGLRVLTVFSYAERFWFGDQEQGRTQRGRHGPDRSGSKCRPSVEPPAINSAACQRSLPSSAV